MSAELTNFAVKTMESVKVIGKEIRVNMSESTENPIPAFWGQCFTDGSVQRMEEHPDRVYPEVMVGWMGDMDQTTHTWVYIVGILAKADAEVPADMVSRTLPETRYAVGTISGTEPDIYMQAHDLTAAEMAKADLQFNDALGCEMEWYEDFCPQADPVVIGMYIPVQ